MLNANMLNHAKIFRQRSREFVGMIMCPLIPNVPSESFSREDPVVVYEHFPSRWLIQKVNLTG